MSNATIEIIDFGGDNQRELETSGDTLCSLHNSRLGAYSNKYGIVIMALHIV